MLNKMRDQKGAVMIIFALMLPILLIVSALAIDYGYLLMRKTELQNAADAAALAGAKQLPNTTNATTSANQYANLNYNNIQQVSVSFAKSNKQIIVNLSANSETYFARIININSVPIKVLAAAELIGPGGAFDYAIFSGSQTDTLAITGGGWTANGAIHSNYKLNLTGGGFTVTGNCEASQGVTITGGGYHVGGVQNNSSIIDMPDFSAQIAAAADAAGQTYKGNKSYTGGGINVTSPIYVKDGNLTVTGGAFNGSGAMMSDKDISITGGGITIGATDQVCFYSKSGNITLTGGGSAFNGVLYAPNGTVTITGGGLTFHGAIVAKKVVLTGGGINIDRTNYDLKSLPNNRISLVQ